MRTVFGTIIASAVIAATAQGEDFVKWVDPFIGTSGDGNCFPGPCRPFGMVQPSPDTGEKTYCGGYKFADTTIRHFSQTHLNGTGRPAMGDIGILPFFSTGLTGLTGLSGGVPPDSRNPVNLVNPVQNKLLTLMVQSMINNDGENPKNCWNAYWENGYIPYFAGEFDKFVPKAQSVSITLELAYDWWCIADFAKAIGDSASAEMTTAGR